MFHDKNFPETIYLIKTYTRRHSLATSFCAVIFCVLLNRNFVIVFISIF